MFLFIMSTILLTGFNLAIIEKVRATVRTKKKIVAGRTEKRRKRKESQILE